MENTKKITEREKLIFTINAADKLLFSATEVRKILGVPATILKKAIENNELKGFSYEGSHQYFTKEAIKNFINKYSN